MTLNADDTLALDGFRWHPCEPGDRFAPASCRVLQRLTRSADHRGEVCHVAVGDKECLLKLRDMQRFGQRIAATLGRSPLHHESQMMRAARQAGLPVPQPLALGVKRGLGGVNAVALLIEWLPGHRTLREQLGNDSAEIYARLLGRVRNAGFADRDFGVGNILIPASTPDATWIDLEATFRAAPADPTATVFTCAAALTSWWVATGGDANAYQRLFDTIRAHTPEPHGGWPALFPRLNARITRRIAKQLRHERITTAPPPLQ